MKNALCSLIGIGLLVIGFVAGAFYQDGKTGYHFEVIEQKEYASSMGTILWVHATESIGRAFLDPGITMIVCGDRTIYKAQREFQESSPFADKVKVNGNVIEWEDGVSRFHLTITEIESAKAAGAR